MIDFSMEELKQKMFLLDALFLVYDIFLSKESMVFDGIGFAINVHETRFYL